MSDQFRVGLSAKMLANDGTLMIPEIDLSPLLDNPNITVESLPDVGTGDLTHDMVKDLDAVALFLERVGDHTFGPNQRLSLIARYGVGYDTVNVASCTAHDAVLAIAPDGVRRPVATTVIAFMLALSLRLITKDRIARDTPNGWDTKTNFNGIGLVGRTLGGVGIGNIGAETFRLAQPFGLRFIAHDPFVDPAVAAELGIELVTLEEVFQQSDFVTVNCPLNDATKGLVNAERLAMMKPTAYLINTARGPIVDEPALVNALNAGVIAGAGLDVLVDEPPKPDNPLLAMDNVILAPHALCFTDQCMAGLGKADIDACLAVMQGQAPSAVVNWEVLEAPGFQAALATYAKQFG
jgi:phosphoglycerate dehydrogenase-like enzyme